MVKEFIEHNNLIAEVVSYPTEMPALTLIKNKKFNPKSIVELNLFLSKKNDLIITIAPFGKKTEESVVEDIFGEELIEANESECFEFTGYKKNFLPAVSIFGAKIIIDSSLEKQNFLMMPLSTKSFLKIPLEEIITYNEDVSFEKL